MIKHILRARTTRRKETLPSGITSPRPSRQTTIAQHATRDAIVLIRESRTYHEDTEDNSLRILSQNIRELKMTITAKL